MSKVSKKMNTKNKNSINFSPYQKKIVTLHRKILYSLDWEKLSPTIMNDIKLMNRAADNIRALAVAMVEKAKSGHPGGAMGGADFINVLYSEFLEYDPEHPHWWGRDRLFLDPGHMSPMLYAVLAMTGKFSMEDLKQFRQWDSCTPGHPERNLTRGIENSSGPLGQGHCFAVGAAMAAKFMAERTGDPTFNRETIYAYISDGGVQEEISQGAGRVAGTLKLNNLIMFYDANDIQLSTETKEVTNEDTAAKYRAWGWRVIEIDGNDVEQIRTALREAKAEKERPTLIIGHCIMGKGARRADGSSYEACCATHGAPLGGDNYTQTIKNLGANIDNPFEIWPDVQALYDRRAEELRTMVKDIRAKEAEWEKQNPEMTKNLERWFSYEAPHIDWTGFTQKRDIPTRNASSAVLSLLAQQLPNMIVSSADLCNSDKTDGFLKHTSVISADNHDGGFFQAGVSELTMACCCLGMMLHGGLMTGCGTFFVFSDYMKPAIRMAALQRMPMKFIWSHDAFRVGEDGPTHQPVEHEAQVRLMEKLKNHQGLPSMIVLRPADADETTVCWRIAMENTETPTGLILSRQNVDSLPEGNNYEGATRGAYIVAESDEDYDVIMVANGSEVSTCVAGARMLRQDGIKVRVVSAPSEGIFMQQDEAYRESVLPSSAKKFGLTAGLPCTLQGLVGSDGFVWGLDSFGFSAPYKILDEKLGFTAENIYNQVKKFLNK